MANAANSPFVKHPALLALFAPRPPPPFKVPIQRRTTSKLTGIANLVSHFSVVNEELPASSKFETVIERKKRIKKEREDAHKKILLEREKKWDPHNNKNATKDPYKTLFVARLSYELTEDDLRKEFERYGRIRDVKLIKDKTTKKSRGYAFIEFERSNDYKEAFQHADGHKLKGRRILVDVERGRTVKTWKPRKLAGGLGKTRAAPSDKNNNNSNNNHNNHYSNHHNNNNNYRNHHSNYNSRSHHRNDRGRDRDRDRDTDRDRKRSDGKYSSRRDKFKDRDRDRRRNDRTDRKDRDRRDNNRDRDRNDNNRDRDNHTKRRSRSRDRKDRKRRDRGDRTHHNDRDNRDRRTDRNDRSDRMNDRDRRDGGSSGVSSRKDIKKDKDRRSKEKNRRR